MTVLVDVQTKSVELMLMAAQVAVGPASMSGWLAGPMTEHVQQRAGERFLGQGEDVSGGGWKDWLPLKYPTIVRRAAGGYGPVPINIRTGQLEHYITQSDSRVTPTATGAYMVYPGTPPGGAELEDKVRTAQEGKTHPPTEPRPVLGLSGPDLEFALASLNAWIVSSITAGS